MIPHWNGVDAELLLYELNTGERRTLASAFQINNESFSPDGEWVSYIAGTQFWGDRLNVVHLQTGKDREIAAVEFGDISQWTSWSPDSRMIAYFVPTVDQNCQTKSQIHVVTVESEESHLIADNGQFWGWSADSAWLAYRVDSDVYAVNVFSALTQRIQNVDQIVGWRPGV